ncbi:glycosyltransferase family 2 protein [Leptothoe kymatousa]|uniref:Glycosyltransferase family 2 protein n=1 Tax=Leptothoe kymatousa TAU-MAC 1615 TaxID=2364775 RepID=A0ABS5Y0V1_9CYAN|nr:glycosyltransferase family 2 protein [Leptothoe kymatousa]MBT9311128.1 glycosyltransferase family 2 protein [Leptothoe kymatousa TAU-MAC 1615]
MTLDNTLVIIPALNEAATIPQVIQALQTQGLNHIRVVDNGSIDGTAQVAAQAGAEVVQEPIKGYGQACWTGLQAMPTAIEWILFCDADGSDDLGQLPEFLAQRQSYDLILGNRRGTAAGRKQLSPVQNFGNWLSGSLIALGWGHRFQDLGPLRLIRKTALDQIGMRDRNFGWTVEMQARAVECGLRICELPVNYLPRQGGTSKISGTLGGSIQAGTIILSTLTQLYWHNLWRGGATPNPEKHQPGLLFLSAFLLVAGTIYTLPHGAFSEPTSVIHFWIGSAIMGVGFILAWMLRSVPGIWFWGVAIATRLLLLTMYPGNDIWRYLWEGYVQLQGFSPYDFSPMADVLKPLRTEWWDQINHPYASAIYPPVTQFGFKTLARIGLWVPLFKAAFAAADLAVCWLLSRRFGHRATLLYAWNPLVLYSFAGGGHYDSWFVLPLVMAWLWFDRPGAAADTLPPFTYLGSAFFVGISIAVKWISLPVLAFVVWHALRRGRIATALGSGILGLGPVVLAAVPFCSPTSCPLVKFGSSFVVTGRCSELIPYIVEQLWEPSRWANWLYAFPLALVVVWLLLRAHTFHKFTEWYLIFLMVISPIIHFWYLSWLMPFLVFSRNLGIRLISLSAYVYFTLLYMSAQEDYSWILPEAQRHILWWPFVLGIAWSSAKITWPKLGLTPKLNRT